MSTSDTSHFVDRRMMRQALLATASLGAVVLTAQGAWAQCVQSGPFFGGNIPVVGGKTPVAGLTPLGAGSSMAALSSTINTLNTAFMTTTSAFVSAPGGAKPDQQGNGVWSRVVAGTVDTTTTSAGGFLATSGAVLSANQCQAKIHQDYTGYQFGFDVAKLNHASTGANIHVGITTGYFDAESKDRTRSLAYTDGAGNQLFSPSGTLTDKTQVPFAGIYSTLTVGNLAVDGMARVDFLRNSLGDSATGLIDQPLNGRSFSLTGNASYQIPLGQNWFIEPSGGLVYSHTEMETLNVAGVKTLDNGIPYARGVVRIGDIDSILTRASITLGTAVRSGTTVWQPYVTASYFEQFGGKIRATAIESDRDAYARLGLGASATDGLKLQMTSEGLGSYWQVAAGTAVVLGNTGWLGYARVDYRNGSNIEGFSGSIGLRHQFSPTAAARQGLKDEPVADDTTVNWTGLYGGLFIGTTWGQQDWSSYADRPETSTGDRGYIGGGQVGYNRQIGRYVVGIEGDLGFSNATGGKWCTSASNPIDNVCRASLNNLGILAGRAGVTWENALIYAKAGMAWADINAATVNNALGQHFVIGSDATQFGWAVGGGIEFALSPRWSTKAEYMHYDLGSSSFAVDNGNRVRADASGDVVRIGVNYHLK